MNDNTISKIACPKCGGSCDKVTDSRPREFLGEMTIYRRRVCSACDNRITTFEIREETFEQMRREMAKSMIQSLLEEMTR